MINPIRVIVHDFPKLLSDFLDFKSFAIKCQLTSTKIQLLVHNALSKISIIDSKILDGYAIIYLNAKFQNPISFAIKSSSTSHINQTASWNNNKFAIKAKTTEGTTKIRQYATCSCKLGAPKFSFDPNLYTIGRYYTLGYWDDFTLEQMDGLTMQELSIEYDVG